MNEELRVGIALFNEGEYHAAHDPWEDRWLPLESGTADEQFLHGLIQFTAAVHHARNRNWEGAIGLAASALTYLDGLPSPYRDVDLEPIRALLGGIRADPETIERRDTPPISFAGEPLRVEDLSPEELAIAAGIIAAEDDFDRSIVETAVAFTRRDIHEGRTSSPIVTLVLDFVRDRSRRPLVFQRLRQHVDRRRDRERDVADVFDER